MNKQYVSEHAPKYEGPYAQPFDDTFDSFNTVIEDFKESLEDGFQLNDIAEWHSLATKSYDIAKDIFKGDMT